MIDSFPLFLCLFDFFYHQNDVSSTINVDRNVSFKVKCIVQMYISVDIMFNPKLLSG